MTILQDQAPLPFANTPPAHGRYVALDTRNTILELLGEHEKAPEASAWPQN